MGEERHGINRPLLKRWSDFCLSIGKIELAQSVSWKAVDLLT